MHGRSSARMRGAVRAVARSVSQPRMRLVCGPVQEAAEPTCEQEHPSSQQVCDTVPVGGWNAKERILDMQITVYVIGNCNYDNVLSDIVTVESMHYLDAVKDAKVIGLAMLDSWERLIIPGEGLCVDLVFDLHSCGEYTSRRSEAEIDEAITFADGCPDRFWSWFVG
jgi:hypothetical protein